ncbi:MAG TPA: preprotein translocase subunit YajC [Clostridiaceae bacterium]|nr:preprotein translocase subunit YajC [Clostridiaceae bacterium]
MMEEQLATVAPLITTIIYIAFIVGIMYLMVYRPQKKREKKEREMRESLKVGDKIITKCGICGKIVNIKDDEITIETSVEKTKIVLKNWAVGEVIKPIEA